MRRSAPAHSPLVSCSPVSPSVVISRIHWPVIAFLVYSLGRAPGNSVSGAGSEIIRRNLDLMWSQKCGGSTAGLVEQY